METTEVTAWEVWIARTLSDHIEKIDYVIELAIKRFNLTNKVRKPELLDALQFFLKWWFLRKSISNRYKTDSSMAYLIDKSRSGIKYYVFLRQPTYEYEENTRKIKEFLES